jgi:hypothetical protein
MRDVLEQQGTGSCGPGLFDHDYQLPPHTTPESPRPVRDEGREGDCHSRIFVGCERQQVYEVVIYQAGTHEWITLRACTPCTAKLRANHARLGPGGTHGVARIRELSPGRG